MGTRQTFLPSTRNVRNVVVLWNDPCQLRARCPSIFSSIAIELNVPRDDFCLIAVELTFVTLGHGFKKAGSVLFDIYAPGTQTFQVRLYQSIFA